MYFRVIGTTHEYPSTFNTRLSNGVFFNSMHSEDYSNVCIIGSGIKDKLFRFEDPLNKKIKIGELWFNYHWSCFKKNVGSGSEDLGCEILMKISISR
jgi:hypothetical protein